MALAWYVMHSKPNKEEFLRSQLCSRDIPTYLPRLRANPVNPRARKFKPFFPGYLFVQVDLDEIPLSTLAWVPGAYRIVSFDGEPATVPEHVIDALKDHLSDLNQARKSEGKNRQSRFKHGDRVRIKSGYFKGYEAIFDENLDDQGRVRLLIKLLRDRQMRVELPEELITRQ